jgi:hypothetical protein
MLRRNVISSLVIAITALALAEALPMPTYMTNREVGYRINYPPTWSTTTYQDVNLLVIADENALLSVDVISIEALPSDDLEALVALYFEDIADQFDAYEALVLVGESLAELDAIRIEYSGLLDGERLIGALILAIDGVYLYGIDYYVVAEFYEEYEATMLAMVESFRFIED